MNIKYYNFFHTTRDSNGVKIKTDLANTLSAELHAVFPHGTFEIIVEIADILGAVSTFAAGNITTILPTQDQIDEFNITNKISKLHGSPLLAMYVTAFNSVNEESDARSLDLLEAAASSNSSYSNDLNDLVLSLTDKTYNQLSILDSFPHSNNIIQATISSNVIVSAVSLLLRSDTGAYIADTKTKEKIVSSIERIAKSVSSMDVASADEYIPLLKNIMTIKAALIKSINTVLSRTDRYPAGDKEVANDMDYDVDVNGSPIPASLEEMYAQNSLKRTREQAGPLIRRMDEVYKQISDAMLKKMVKGDVHYVTIDAGVTCVLGKIGEDELEDKSLVISSQTENPAYLTLPMGFCPSMFVDEFTICVEEFDLRMTVTNFETRTYSSTAFLLTSQTSVVEVDVMSIGRLVHVKNQFPAIFISIPHITTSETLNFTNVNVTDSINSHIPLVYHHVNISYPQTSFLIEIIPLVRFEDYVALLDYGRYPTLRDHKWKFFTNEHLQNDGTISIFISSLENQNRTGSLVLAVGKLKRSLSVNQTIQKTDLDENFSSNYELRVLASGCYYFDEETELWKDGTSVVVIKFNETFTNCSTNHLTEFGSGFASLPVKLTFQLLLLNMGYSDEFSVFVVIAILVSSFILLMIWGHYRDRLDLKKRISVPLPDNNPNDNYAYELLFHTGPDSEAACESNISFILSGEYSETNVRNLPSPCSDLYRRYDHNNFIMTTSEHLGPIHNLRVMHDNCGRPPYDSWQLERVIIHDLQLNEFYFFDTSSWLSLDRHGSSVDTIFSCSNELSSLNFSQRFYSSFHHAINNDHMWLSIFLCPIGSRFRRKERISVAVTFLLLSASLSTLYFTYEGETVQQDGMGLLYFLTISLSETLIGIIVHFCCYLLILPLIFILKRARPKELLECRSIKSVEGQRKNQNGSKVFSEANALSKHKLKFNYKSSERRKVKPVNLVLPWWLRYLSWFILFISIAGSVGFVIVFSSPWGQTTFQKWFVTFLVSFMFSMFITEWIGVICSALHASTCGRTVHFDDIDFDENLPYFEGKLKDLTSIPNRSSTVQNVNLVKGIEKHKVSEVSGRLKSYREMKFLSKGIGMYCCFLIILIIIAADRTDINGFLLQKHYAEMFIRQGDPLEDLNLKVSIILI